MGKRKELHGQSRSKTYALWVGMVYRCTKPYHSCYHRYGGRGITVCDRWLSFQNFLDDMGHPAEGMSLDRIDNSKGYSPDNCRWATRKQQCNNTRKNRVVEWQGERLTLTQLAEKVGVSRKRIGARLQAGWTLERAIQPPLPTGRAMWKGGVRG